MLKPIETKLRPAFDQWCRDRGVSNIDGAARLNCHPITFGRYRLPFGNANRRVPDDVALAAIVEWTAGEIGAADFYPPELRGSACIARADRVAEDVA